MDKEQADWMLKKHKCDDCSVKIALLSKEEKWEHWLFQCTRCKTVWQTPERILV